MPVLDETSPMLQDPVPWRFDSDLFFTFEIDVDAVGFELPRGAFLQEVRPGVGLVGMGVTTGMAGNLGHLPAFLEINWSVLLRPDVSRPMPVPGMAVLTGAIGSDCQAFLDHAARVDRMAVRPTPGVRATFGSDRLSVRVEDDHGPIVEMWSTDPNPLYRPWRRWIQVASGEDGEWIQAVRFEASVHEHQKGHEAAVFHAHPFFDGIDVAGLGSRCYLQMHSQPGAQLHATFYAPVPQGRPGRRR